MHGRSVVAMLLEQEHGFVVVDAHDQRLVVGSRTRPYTWNCTGIPGGTVTCITEPEGDVDDEGRSIGINPRITVLFDDGVKDDFNTSYQGSWYDDGKFVCEDVVRGSHER